MIQMVYQVRCKVDRGRSILNLLNAIKVYQLKGVPIEMVLALKREVKSKRW